MVANKVLFQPAGPVVNEAGGSAVKLSSHEALSQYAVTGCLNNTFYADAKTQLDMVLKLARECDPAFVAKVAIYAREKGAMKDIPALLTVFLAAAKQKDLLSAVFPRVITNAKMLRNFVQMLRSNVTGRKSMGSQPKRLVANWFNARTSKEIFMQSTGENPSLKDVIRLSHPRALDDQKAAMFKWLLGLEPNWADLPACVQEYERFRRKESTELPQAPPEMLMGLELTTTEWCQLALRAGWHWLRMNLNTLKRHGVFDVSEMPELIAERLRDEEAIRKSRAYPYQIMNTVKHAADAPAPIQAALQDALEISLDNVPTFPGNGYVLIDISSSMRSPITGSRAGATTKVNCCDVAALIGCAVLRKNPDTVVLGFNDAAHRLDLNPKESVLSNARAVAARVTGGTNCSAPMVALNSMKATGGWVLMISDNQSWLESIGHPVTNWSPARGETALQKAWTDFRVLNPESRMACLDIQPYSTTQLSSSKDVLNVGGFSDSVFDIIGQFFRGELDSARAWVEEIDKVAL